MDYVHGQRGRTMHTFIIFSAAMLAVSPAPAVSVFPACKLRAHVAIACLEDDSYGGGGNVPAANAAALAQRYGLNVQKMRADYTRQFLAQFNCAAVRDDGPVSLEVGIYSKWKVATEDGYVMVDRAEIRRPGHIANAMIPDIYLSSSCVPSGDTKEPLPEPSN